jgi:hypothetical protein
VGGQAQDQEADRTGINFMKLHFGRKLFGQSTIQKQHT